jgi:sec-independent protein translocase protein TatB
VLRTLGQYTRKIRSMAADFQSQFQEAMREAEMADLKKSVDDLAHDIKSYDPLKGAREDVEAIGKDLNKDLSKDFENKPLDLMTPQTPGVEPSAAGPAAEPSGVEPVVAEPAGVEPVIAGSSTPAAEPAQQPPEPAIAATPESTERTG